MDVTVHHQREAVGQEVEALVMFVFHSWEEEREEFWCSVHVLLFIQPEITVYDGAPHIQVGSSLFS